MIRALVPHFRSGLLRLEILRSTPGSGPSARLPRLAPRPPAAERRVGRDMLVRSEGVDGANPS